MYRAANTSRFLIDSSSERGFADLINVDSHHDDLFRQIVVSELARSTSSLHVFRKCAQRLIRLAEHAFSLRDASNLHKVSLILLNLPMAEARQIGKYYQALAIRRSGKIEESLPLFEELLDNGPLAYRARALQTLGAIYHKQGLLDEALRLYPEAARAASPENGSDLLTTLLVNQEIASIKSEKGDHQSALADYKSLWPLVRIVSRDHPLYFYFYHNELAVEFAELGRINEAEAACAIALASPFAAAYPEISATRDEIAAKHTSSTPSVVAINHPPEAQPSPQVEPQPQLLRTKAVAIGQSLCDNNSQRSVFPIPATATNVRTAISILEQVLICMTPRAPPSPF